MKRTKADAPWRRISERSPVYSRAACLALTVAMCGFLSAAVCAQCPPAPTVCTFTTLMCSETPLVVGDQTYCTATVTEYWSGEPTSVGGAVTFTVEPASAGYFSPTATQAVDAAGQATVTYYPTNGDISTHVIRAVYPLQPWDPPWASSEATFNQVVVKRSTDVDLDFSPTTTYVNQPITCTVHLADNTTAGTPSVPGGTNSVTFGDGGKNGTFVPAGPVTPVAGSYTVVYTPAAGDVGTTTITATYAGSSVHAGAAQSQQVTVELRETDLTLDCSSTTAFINQSLTCIVRLEDDTTGGVPVVPEGTNSLSFDDCGKNGTFVPAGPVTPVAGSYTVVYTPAAGDVGTTTITATYAGSTVHAGATQSKQVTVEFRETDLTLDFSRTTAFINQSLTCIIRLEDDTTEGVPAVPEGTNSLSFDDGGKNGAFVPAGPVTPVAGTYTVVYTPAPFDAGTTTITATYTGSDVHAGAAQSQQVTVELRPTETIVTGCPNILVNETCAFGVAINDKSGASGATAATGTGTIARLTPKGAATVPGSVAIAGTASFNYTQTTFLDPADANAVAGQETIEVTFTPSDGIHESSIGEFVQAIQRRPTETSLNCTANATGCWCTAGVAEDGTNAGTPVTPITGQFRRMEDNTIVAGAGFQVNSNDIVVSVTVRFEASNNIHLDSTDSVVVDRSNFVTEDTDGDGLKDSLDVGADLADASGNGGELGADTLDSIDDPDSDGDGLSDGEEYHTGTDRLDWDSDDDGLSDYEEVRIYFTNPLSVDTDGDGADGVLGTRDPAFIDGGHPVLAGYTGPDTIVCASDCEEAFSGTTMGGFVGNPLDETDPLQLDTDGDGIEDRIEFPPGCNEGAGGPGTGAALYDGFANSFDSDGDGLLDSADAIADVFDGAPGTNHTPTSRGWLAYPETPLPVAGGTKTAGDGINDGEVSDDAVTCLCDADSDGDGLLDGEEKGIGTDPYDWDTDDDGRGDAEELTGGGPIPTDPADFDTDDDGLGDGVEVSGANPTNPVNADTDSDGLCDGGKFTPSAVAGIDGSGTSPLVIAGVNDHPNPYGYGEDEDGTGAITAGETNPNDPDTDGDAVGDGVEKLGFSTSRQAMIPAVDLFGRPINVTYPSCGCMDPLDADTDNDNLSDGYEDRNHDGNFDFLQSEFDHADPLPGPPIPYPTETNPCNADTDDDGLNDNLERDQPNPSAFSPFNPTNPLDHDTDNDRIYDGPEVNWICTAITFSNLDNDGDALFDEDPIDELDNDGDGLVDEDPEDFTVQFVDCLDPTNRDSDSDGFIDGLDEDPCNSELIPILQPVQAEPVDIDRDGFADDDEVAAGTHPNDPEDHPEAFSTVDLDFDQAIDDRMWLEPVMFSTIANSVVIDIDSNVLIDVRVGIVQPRDVRFGDFDSDGFEDDVRYVIEYAFANYRVLQPRIVATIDDYDGDLVIDWVVVEKK